MRLVGLAGMMLMLLVGCSDKELPTQPITINVVNNNTNSNVGAGGPGVSASPQPGQPSGPPATVRVTQFSQSPGDRSVAIGTQITLTCTPRKADGTDYWLGVQDSLVTAPTQFGQVAGDATCAITKTWSNGYNLDVKCSKVGNAYFTCSVLGVSTTEPFILQVTP